jgi:hypothetical protein
MNKKEIALTLGGQYAALENEYWELADKKQEARNNNDMELATHYNNQQKILRGKMDTIEQSKELLGINAKQWYNAITETYILNSKEAEKETNNIYWYEYTLRGFSLGCQPKGFIEHNDNIGRHGIVSYDRQLTNEELSDYELIPYNKAI